MITPRRNSRWRGVGIESLTLRAVIACNKGKFTHTAQRSSLRQRIGLVSFSVVDTQMLRPLQAGRSRLAWPHRRGPATLPGTNRGPKVALGSMGGASIHGPHLVAWPVGSEWRNRHLQQKTIHPDNELKDQET